MKQLAQFVTPPSECSYLPGQAAQLEYVLVSKITPAEYQHLMSEGWRRFGHMLFHPVCRQCHECRTIRVLVDRFQPNRSQRRVRKLNEGQVRLRIGAPSCDREKLDLYDRYHLFQSGIKDWPLHAPKQRDEYIGAYVNNPFPTHEYGYYLGDRLVGVGYVDVLPESLSAIYFFYEPELRDRSLGTWNVLSVIEQAALSGRPYVYLGYFVAGCESLEYKANFAPNQIRGDDGRWRDFRA
jgi:arginyl-tRNA--protein-N-Asp/Glu arginylyltransferase